MSTSAASAPSAPGSKSLSQMIRQHPLFFYFVLAYTISWLLSIPAILSDWKILPPSAFLPFFIIKSFGPALAAYWITRTLQGQTGMSNLRRRILYWHVGWQWYGFVFLAVPVFMLLGIAVLPGAMATFQGLPSSFGATLLIGFITILFGGGALGEEPGWRGFALPRMQSRYGALRGTMLLGVLWTFWHLPDFLTFAQKGGPDTGLYPFYAGLPVFFVEVMALAIIFTWVFNQTGGSVFIVILLHASYNTFGLVQSLFSAPIVTGTDLPFVIGVGVPALVILVMTRGRLGYDPAQEQSTDTAKNAAQILEDSK
jgi:membrane protease YdiL (CAAX protease family)